MPKFPLVKGNVKYFAYFDTVQEMLNDVNIDPEYYVTVIGGRTKVNYVITETPMDKSMAMKNGLYATPVILGNEIGSTVEPEYSTVGPIEYPVGGIPAGTEFRSIKLSDLMTHMLFEPTDIKFEIKPKYNATDYYETDVHIRGQKNELSYLEIDIARTKKKVKNITVAFNDVVYKSEDVDWEAGRQIIDVRETQGTRKVPYVFFTDLAIKVVLTDEDLNTSEVTLKEKTIYPIVYDVCGEVWYGATDILDYMASEDTRHMKYENFEVTRSLVNRRMYIAIPHSYSELISVKDDNGFDIMGIYEQGPTISVHIGDYTVGYDQYRSEQIMDDKAFAFTYGVREVNI